MSGPKYNRALIREINRQIKLERERVARLEERKRQQIISDINKVLADCQKCYGKCDLESYKTIIKEAKSIIPDSITLKQLNDTVLKIEKSQNYKFDASGKSEKLIKELAKCKQNMFEMKNNIKILGELKKQLKEEANQELHDKNIASFLDTKWEDTGERISNIPVDLQKIYYEVMDELAGMPDYELQKKQIDETIMKTGDLTFKKRQLEMRKQAIIIEKNSSQNVIEILSLENELRGLYSLLGWEAKKIPTDINELKSSIEEANNYFKQKDEAEYISKCLHEVLQEKGYSLIEDSIVSNNSGSTQKSYFEFGEDSLLNVSMSSQGQMLFEIVGDGTEEGMTESRKAKLVSEMRRFCPNYAEIKEILMTRYGISLEDEHLCEPDEKYAKAIDINTKKSERRAGKEKKVMHFDD